MLDEVIKKGKQKKKGKGTASSSKDSGNESLVSKAAKSTNARKKALATT